MINWKISASLGVLVTALGVAKPASAALLEDVGTLDTAFCHDTLADSGLGAENTFLEGCGLTGYSITGKFEWEQEDIGDLWEVVTDDVYSDSYAANFQQLFNDGYCVEGTCSTTPDYYVIKVGTGGVPYDSHWLFQNNASTGWAYLTLSQFCGSTCPQNFDVFRLSHMSTTGGVSVPEPATLSLLGLGLVAVGLTRRRRAA